ncbi:MAG TPA: hypothetical protein VJZ02_00035 [Candidatus Brocadiales bacterium]|nr:hypothetical protein [Candidatus Brocadiales bacterium]
MAQHATNAPRTRHRRSGKLGTSKPSRNTPLAKARTTKRSGRCLTGVKEKGIQNSGIQD